MKGCVVATSPSKTKGLPRSKPKFSRPLLLTEERGLLDQTTIQKARPWKAALLYSVFCSLSPDYPARLRISSSTTFGSASVEVSPKFSMSFAAILRRMRRMILPERVLGRFCAH